MGHLDVFRRLTFHDGRLGFHTKETKDKIPEIPGCYAWFLPLWLYSDDLDELMQIIADVLDYEQDPEKKVKAPFTWASVHMRVHRETAIRAIDNGMRETWKKLLADKNARDTLQETLMTASLFMPPLYVGKTKNLKQRYLQHTDKANGNRNNFHSRFTEKAVIFRLSVSDLLFVSVSTENELGNTFPDVAQDEFDVLVEKMLMQFCRPPFSLR